MSANEAEDWLGVALGEVLRYPASVLYGAATEARRTCTHHAQIVPAIVSAADDEMTRRRRLADLSAPVHLEALPPPPPISEAEFERLVFERGVALSAHIDRGSIISNGDGTFKLANRA